MAAKTHYAQHLWLNWLKGSAMPSPPSALYLGLLTASPTDSGATTSEVAGNGYARQAVPFGALTDMTSGCVMPNSAPVTFPAATGPGWGSVAYAALFDAAAGGNMLEYGALPTPLAVIAGYVVTFPAGNITDLDQ